jgi:hypothetical protein
VTRAIPARVVLNRSVTRKPTVVWLTIGGPSEVRTARLTPPPPPPAVTGTNLAVTDFAVLSVSVQFTLLAAERHAPAQPANVFPAAAAAVNVTVLPAAYFWMQVFVRLVPMHFPSGADTVPLPWTVIASVPGGAVEKVAETIFAEVIDTVQVSADPLQAPPQEVKEAPAVGVAVSVTADPVGRLTLHAAEPLPHWIPPPVTVPLPTTDTERGTVGPPPPPVVNVAITDLAAVIWTVQVGIVPLQAPPQLTKVAPAAGVAVRVTVAVVGVVLHTVAPFPQLIPGPFTTPGPETETVSRKPPAATPNVAVTLFD